MNFKKIDTIMISYLSIKAVVLYINMNLFKIIVKNNFIIISFIISIMIEIILALTIFFSFLMSFSIGANDAANALATSYGSNALRLPLLLIGGSIFEFIGAMFFSANVTAVLS